MKRKIINDYALYKAVILETIDGTKLKGWLIPKGREYLLLPFDDIWSIHHFTASYIKDIVFMTNKVSLNKLVKQLSETLTIK